MIVSYSLFYHIQEDKHWRMFPLKNDKMKRTSIILLFPLFQGKCKKLAPTFLKCIMAVYTLMIRIVDYNNMQIDEELRRYSDPMIGIFTCLTAHHTNTYTFACLLL